MRFRSLLLLTLLLPLRGPAAAQQPAAGDAYSGELKTLQQEYAKAQQVYLAPYYAAKTEEERNKVKFDPAKEPSHAFVAKYQALARKADGTTTGAQATLMVTNLAASANDKAAAREAYRTLLTRYADRPEAERAVAGLRYAGYTIGQGETRNLLTGVIHGQANDKLKAAALFTLGANLLDDRSGSEAQKKDARRLFDELKQKYAGSPYAQRADGALFELENLQIGKVAPDFDATDENGKPFKLSDYRGKVVVLDFWGFW